MQQTSCYKRDQLELFKTLNFLFIILFFKLFHFQEYNKGTWQINTTPNGPQTALLGHPPGQQPTQPKIDTSSKYSK